MDVSLNQRQAVAFTSRATEILYGGAAFGGKSYYLRVSAIRWCLTVGGVQVYLFRRTFPDLRANHLRGPTSFFVMLADGLKDGRVKYRAAENEFVFENGSVIHLCHCQYEADVQNYLGAEIHVLMMDELTHFTDYQYRFLRGRVRAVGLKVMEGVRGLLPRVECASNPGSIGHAWVKRTWMGEAPERIWRAAPEEGGMLRQYIPAKMADNTIGMSEDPEYANRLRGLGSDQLIRAMLDGDWDIVAGQAFENLSKVRHGVKPFKVPHHWMKFGSLDWGSSKPFSFGLWAVSDGEAVEGGRVYPRGALIRIGEWYGWRGQADIGLRLESDEVAAGILERTSGYGKLAYVVADPAMWNKTDGPSPAERMGAAGLVLRKANNDRLTGYLEVRWRLRGDGDEPMLYAFDSCQHGFWRTMPELVMDEDRPEDVDTTQEDHAYDDVRYACMSRAWVREKDQPKEKVDKWFRAFDEEDEESWITV